MSVNVTFSCNVLSRWVQLVSVFSRMDSDIQISKNELQLNPFAPGDFAEKRVLKLVEWFSGHCRAIKS